MESFGVVDKVLLLVCCLSLVELKPLAWNDANPVVLVRLKRTPSRAFTFSGFNPSSGLSAFATSADFLPSFYRYAPSPPSSNFPAEVRESYLPSADSDSTYNYPPSVEYPTVNSEEDRKIPPQNLTPPAETAPNTGYNANSNAIQDVKKPKKKPNRVNPAPIQDEEDTEDDNKSRSSSSASFNAWFPIVLGSYPRSNEAYKDENAPIKERPGSTVIANSVSNGRSGVASSHAVLYGGESPMQSYRRG